MCLRCCGIDGSGRNGVLLPTDVERSRAISFAGFVGVAATAAEDTELSSCEKNICENGAALPAVDGVIVLNELGAGLGLLLTTLNEPSVCAGTEPRSTSGDVERRSAPVEAGRGATPHRCSRT